jgi:hypothetical protein
MDRKAESFFIHDSFIPYATLEQIQNYFARDNGLELAELYPPRPLLVSLDKNGLCSLTMSH